MSQYETVVDHLQQFGSITQMEALTKYGIMRLAPIIGRLRESEDLWTEYITTGVTGRKFARYHTTEPVECGNKYCKWEH